MIINLYFYKIQLMHPKIYKQQLFILPRNKYKKKKKNNEKLKILASYPIIETKNHVTMKREKRKKTKK